MPDTETATSAQRPEGTLPPYLRALAGDGSTWYGCLTVENAELVAARIQRLLSGRLYSWAYDCLSPDSDLDLRTSLKIRNGEVRATVAADHAMVGWSDAAGSHDLYSAIRDRAHEVDLSYEDKRRRGVWLHFEGERFSIDSFAIGGTRCRSTVRVEYPEHLSDDYA